MLEAKVIDIVSKVLNVPVVSLTAQSGLGKLAQWDSLHHTTLVIELETVFDIGFDFDELDQIVTIDAIVRSLKAKGVSH
jgi:acyl carrier protein